MDVLKKFGERIKDLRKELKISQEELAFKAELHRTYISSIERGEQNISLRNIEKLAKALKVEMRELV
ncbi:MAG TPA: helix-turn-helix transcriptional regulator [bacterium]|nr:helix-turn-helix transcriptional regulator [bacterium]